MVVNANTQNHSDYRGQYLRNDLIERETYIMVTGWADAHTPNMFCKASGIDIPEAMNVDERGEVQELRSNSIHDITIHYWRTLYGLSVGSQIYNRVVSELRCTVTYKLLVFQKL